MISKKEVQHIAKLARLGITKEEEKKFQKELSSILDYFKSLQEVDVSRIEPTFHATQDILIKKSEIMREDKERPRSEELANKLIKLAPDKKGNHLKVRAVFD